MARPGRTERNRAARSFRQLRRFHHVINSDKVFGTHNGARNRHFDNEKFCIDLNGPKTPKMSERPLKTLRYFETSKLNTRGRFPSPAPSNSSDLAGTLDLVPTTAKSRSRLQAECLSSFCRCFHSRESRFRRGVPSSILHTHFRGSFAFVCAITVDRRRLRTNFVA